ncbi:MAG: SRPBCC family protein [Pseudomonadota bacterium]|nr:SRPBCC family protein [Pseudomonadota bacterium]
MDFDFKSNIPATPEVVWSHVSDITAVATCVPGVTEVIQESDSHYTGTLKVRVGPVGLQLNGVIDIEGLDHTERSFLMVAQAKDRKIPGEIKTRTELVVCPDENGATELRVNTNANILGKLGEFGQPVIRKKTQKVMEEFVENLVKRIEAAEGA